MKRSVGVVLCCLAMGASLAPAVAVASAPRTPFTVAAVFPPWWTPDRIDREADALGVVSGRGALANVVVIHGDVDLLQRARRSGALWLADPDFLAFCVSS